MGRREQSRAFSPRIPFRRLPKEAIVSKAELAELRAKAQERDDYFRAIQILQPQRQDMIASRRKPASLTIHTYARGYLQALDDFGAALLQAQRERED